jgi:hypothetical protein
MRNSDLAIVSLRLKAVARDVVGQAFCPLTNWQRLLLKEFVIE